MTPTPESSNRNRAFILLLVLAAGCVDAIGFSESGMFPANMTGNAVLLATALAKANEASFQEAILPGLALLGFCLGAAIGSLWIHSLSSRMKRTPFFLLLLSGLLLASCGVLQLLLPGHDYSPTYLPIIALAMGMQSAGALELNVPGAGITTVITSTLTTVISGCIGFLKRVFTRERQIGSAPLFPALVVFCYFGGAMLGAWHPGISTPGMIIIAGSALGLFSVLLAL